MKRTGLYLIHICLHVQRFQVGTYFALRKKSLTTHQTFYRCSLALMQGVDRVHLQRLKKQRIRPAKPAHRFGFCSESGGERKKAISFTSGGSLGEPITRPEKVSFGRLIGPRVKAHQITRIRSRNNPSYLSGNKGDVKGFRNHIDSLGGQNYGFHYFFYLICIFHRESSPSSSLFSNHFILLVTTTFLDFAIKRL